MREGQVARSHSDSCPDVARTTPTFLFFHFVCSIEYFPRFLHLYLSISFLFNVFTHVTQQQKLQHFEHYAIPKQEEQSVYKQLKLLSTFDSLVNQILITVEANVVPKYGQ